MSQDDEAILAMHDSKMSVDSIAAMMGLRSPSRLAVRLDALLRAREAACQPAHEPEVAARIVECWGRARGSGRASAVSEVALTIERRVESGGCAPAVYVVEQLPQKAKPPPSAYQGATPAKLRFCRWFIDAGWQLGTTAWLFDLEPEDLAEALAL